MIVVELDPRSPFHVGEQGVGREETLEYVPSDTLYAAMVVAWVAAGDGGPFTSPPFRITSAFPRLGAVRLYPRPFVRIRADRQRWEELGKTLTQFAWCSERIFTMLLQGEDMTPLAAADHFIAGIWLHPDDRSLLPPPPEGMARWETFWRAYFVPHVSVDRSQNRPNLFYSGRVTFGPGCGLWFGVEPQQSDAVALLERALHYLADTGLGGLRSTGHGAFTFTTQETNLPVPSASSGYAVTLSRYLPADAAEAAAVLQADHAAYKLVRVGGWCPDDAGHLWRRKQVRMVREGSVLHWNGSPLGRIADLKPENVGRFGDRPVLRYGLAFPVPVAEEALL